MRKQSLLPEAELTRSPDIGLCKHGADLARPADPWQLAGRTKFKSPMRHLDE
jgi:hypothetical protein